ncbi:MAG: acyl carrier protein [Armatimonadota bacterium]
MDGLRRRIRHLIAEACDGIPLDEVPEAASIEDVAGWDSLAHIVLVELVEREFGRTVSDDRIGDLRSVDGIIRWVRSSDAKRPPANRDTRPATEVDVEAALRHIGLASGDLVMVHSFTPALGGFKPPPETVTFNR